MSNRRMFITGASALLLVGGWSTWRWASAPRAPDVRTADLHTVIGFMGSEDYSRISQVARADYARGVTDRFAAALLERFYERPASQRSFILRTLARAQGEQFAREAGTADDYRSSLHRLLSRQPPRVQGMYTQFASDLRREREGLR
jgi:hypothetical protein